MMDKPMTTVTLFVRECQRLLDARLKATTQAEKDDAAWALQSTVESAASSDARLTDSELGTGERLRV